MLRIMTFYDDVFKGCGYLGPTDWKRSAMLFDTTSHLACTPWLPGLFYQSVFYSRSGYEQQQQQQQQKKKHNKQKQQQVIGKGSG